MTGTQTQSNDLERLREIVKDIDFCMLTTVDEDGHLHSRPMSVNGEIDPNGDLWFFTRASSHKAAEIGNAPGVNASFADTDKNCYVSMSGNAELVRDREKIKQLWKPQFQAWFPDGVDEPDLALLRVRVEQAEYWDGPSSTIAQAFSFVSALVTGKEADFGENKKLNLG